MLIPLIVLVIVLICIAVNKNTKSDNTLQQLKDKEVSQPLSTYERLVEKEKELTDTKTVFLFKDMEFDLTLFSYSKDFIIKGHDVFVSLGEYWSEGYNYRGLEVIYSDSKHAYNKFIDDFIKEAVPIECSRKILKGLLKDNSHTGGEAWLQIGEGVYFTNTDWNISRLSDWKHISNPKEVLKLIQGMEIKRCEDPHKTHWKHFLELEMRVKKQREIDCVKFIDKILDKQKEYNDLQYKYDMLPSAPISDFESFTNFCNVVHEKVHFNEYEITNILLLKKSKY